MAREILLGNLETTLGLDQLRQKWSYKLWMGRAVPALECLCTLRGVITLKDYEW